MGSSVALAAEARKRCSVKGLITFHTYYTCKRGGHTALLSGDVRICVYIYICIFQHTIYIYYIPLKSSRPNTPWACNEPKIPFRTTTSGKSLVFLNFLGVQLKNVWFNQWTHLRQREKKNRELFFVGLPVSRDFFGGESSKKNISTRKS